MISALNAIFDILRSGVSFLGSLVKGIVRLLTIIPNVFQYLVDSFSYLPLFFTAILVSSFSFLAFKAMHKYK